MTGTDVAAATLSSWIAHSGLPRHEAERLAAHGLGTTWSGLWARMDEPVDASALDALASRRLRGEPLAYIEGSTNFYGLEIACGPGVLVPRPETETLVDVALESISDIAAPVVVDVGTGSGAIAIAIAKHRPDAQVWATDASPEAVVWAERNVRTHGARVRVVCCDLLEGAPAGDLDLVVSNPPYVSDGTELPPDVMAEPHNALFAGPRGTEVLERLATVGCRVLAVEVGTPEQATWFAELTDGTVTLDHTGRPRVVCATR